MSPRRRFMETLVRLWKEAEGGRYFVKRGPINWASFMFEESPGDGGQCGRAVAITLDESTLRPGAGTDGPLDEGTISFDIGTEYQNNVDAPLDEMFDHAVQVFKALASETDDVGDMVATVNRRDASGAEWQDDTRMVCGVLVAAQVRF